jgi:hypothetical protein
VRVTNTCTPVNALCMYMYTILLWHIFNRKVPELWYKFLKTLYITYNRLTVSPTYSNRVHYVNRRSPLNRFI